MLEEKNEENISVESTDTGHASLQRILLQFIFYNNLLVKCKENDVKYKLMFHLISKYIRLPKEVLING